MNSIILTREEIDEYNIRMMLEEDTLVLLRQFPKIISRKQLLTFLNQDIILNISPSKEILKNRNIKNIKETIPIESGITIQRDSIRFFPTFDDFYSNEIVNDIIATELSFATPVLILHHSLDEKWYYIQTHFYRGWFPKESILLVNEKDRLLFENPKNFIVITHPIIPYYGNILDLGTTFPLLGIHNTYYEIFIPTKKGITIQKISKEISHLGYLPFTKKNIVDCALSYLDIPYTWGGTHNGIDCSLFIYTLFHVFGFIFPRDTKNQEKIIGMKKIDLKGKTELEKKRILESISYPAILHKKGHILLALSSTQVIHAYGECKKVILSSLEDCYGTNLYPFLTTVSCFLP